MQSQSHTTYYSTALDLKTEDGAKLLGIYITPMDTFVPWSWAFNGPVLADCCTYPSGVARQMQ
jgi:hypothetical protein